MPRTSEQNESIRDKRKTKILERTLRLFAINGFDSVTIDDITVACNCSHGLFYHYFKSKEDVFNALIELKNEKYKDYLIPKNAAIEAGGIKGLKLICDYCEKFIGAPDEAIYLSRLSTTRRYTTTSYNEALLGEDPFPYLVDLIKQGQIEGTVIAGDSQEIANVFVDFINGATYRRIFEGSEKYQPVSSLMIIRIFQK
jgi:AcrR family transcriptional regulator